MLSAMRSFYSTLRLCGVDRENILLRLQLLKGALNAAWLRPTQQQLALHVKWKCADPFRHMSTVSW
jgi:hypothetical protein